MSLGLLLSLAIVECSQAVEAGGVRSGEVKRPTRNWSLEGPVLEMSRTGRVFGDDVPVAEEFIFVSGEPF